MFVHPQLPFQLKNTWSSAPSTSNKSPGLSREICSHQVLFVLMVSVSIRKNEKNNKSVTTTGSFLCQIFLYVCVFLNQIEGGRLGLSIWKIQLWIRNDLQRSGPLAQHFEVMMPSVSGVVPARICCLAAQGSPWL